MSEFTDYLQDRLYLLLIDFGINNGEAIKASHKFVTDIKTHFNGDYIYIGARGTVDDVARRMAIIRDRKRGDKADVLVRRYGLSRATIYRIIRGIK